MAGKMRQGLGCGLDVIGCGTGMVVNADRSSSHSILRDRLGSGIDDMEGESYDMCLLWKRDKRN